MAFPSFLRRLFASTPDSDTALEDAASIQEQINPTYFASSPTQEDWYWGRLATGSEEDFYWRRLSDNWLQKDVIPSTYLELHNTCYEAYNANPLAFAIIEITTSFVLGKGVVVAATEPAVQDVLMDFWHDLDNHMDTRVYALCTELSLYGEQFIRFFVSPYDGRVKIRQIDPSLIDQVETDPEEDGRAIKLMIAVGAQLPEHYLSDGNYGNRATASEMGLPTFLKFQRRQLVLRSMLRAILDRVLQEARKAGRLAEQIDTHYDILFPDIDVADHQTLASATQLLVSALTAAKEQGWVSDETAMRLLFQFAGEEIDTSEEQARIRKEPSPCPTSPERKTAL